MQPFTNHTVKEMVLVSACLLGLKCCYNGCDNTNTDVIELRNNYSLIPVCPEQLAGFPTPRPPAFFIEGDGKDTLAGKDNIINDRGKKVAKHFCKGAKQALKICKVLDIKMVVLKERSPSCGTNQIYLQEKLTNGMGVTASLLKLNGIRVISENDLKETT